jgi:tetratricopeptide (TPR) repeat protein
MIVYFPALHAGFVWDDDLFITDNPLVKNPDGLRYIWFSSASADYAPLTLTAFWFEWRLWADNATGYHLVNILLNAAGALLVWRVLEKLAVPGAWLAAILFAVHPVNAASVAWIAERRNTLSLLFYLLSISMFLDFHAQKKRADYALSLAFFACALFSKGSVVMLPFVLLGCVWWRTGKITRSDLIRVVPFFVLAALLALVTIHFQSRVIEPGTQPSSFTFRLVRAGEAVWFYVGKVVFPINLCAIYPKWPIRPEALVSYVPGLLAAALLLVFWSRRKSWGRPFLFAWGYFLVTLFPALGFIGMTFMDQAYVADWWQQISMIGLIALIAAGIARAGVAIGKNARPFFQAATAAFVLLLGGLTWSEAATYESMETHCRRTLARNPDAWSAHNNLGTVLSSDGRLDEAIVHYEAALRLKPSDGGAHNNLGTVFARRGRYDEAIAQYRSAIAIRADDASAHFNLGNSLHALHRDREALQSYTHALDISPRWPAPRSQVIEIFMEDGNFADAREQAGVLLSQNPDSISARFLIARALAGEGKFADATTEARAALELARRAGQEKIAAEIQSAIDGYSRHGQ